MTQSPTLVRPCFWLRLVLALPVALFSTTARSQEVLVDLGETWSFFRGSQAPSSPATAWREQGFNDGSWEAGATPIGYERATGGLVLSIATELEDMPQIDDDPGTPQDESQEGYLTFYVRKTFNVTQGQIDAITNAGDPDANLLLGVGWDDGFICYLNGTEVARSQTGAAGNELAYDDPSTGQHEADGLEYFDITASATFLSAGSNLIAVEVHNANLTSSDCSLDLQLTGNDPRLECPGNLACAASPGAVELTWENSTVVTYDSISVLRNGSPIAGSPFAPDTVTATDDAPGNFFNLYEVIATVDGVDCAPLLCATGECPGGISCTSSAEGVTISWTNSPNVLYDSITVTRNGVPILGSPFPGGTQSVLDGSPGDFLNTYEVTATIGGQACNPPLTCESDNELRVIDDDEEWRFFRGTVEPPVDWMERTFDDSAWESGNTGIGYGDNDDNTVLEDMEQIDDDPDTPEDESQPGYLTVYARKAFNLADPGGFGNLILRVDYDDGFIAYLNGVEVARSGNMGAPGTPYAFDQESDSEHEADGYEDFDISGDINELRTGNNVLAVQVHNTSLDSSDLSFIPRLVANSCFEGSGLSCTYDGLTGEVIISFDPLPADFYEVLRNGSPLPDSPYPGDTTLVVDSEPSASDNDYEIISTVAGVPCDPVSCSITCEDREPEALTCTLRLVDDLQGGRVTEAELTWSTPPGTSSIEVEREGTLLETLPPTATSYVDPDVEAEEPEDDTDYEVIFQFADGTTCTIGCAPQSLCPENLICESVDTGGILRARLTWDNVVKDWERIDIERDADGVIASIDGTATSYTDSSLELVPGVVHTYTVIPVAPPGEGAPGEADEVDCSESCDVTAQIPELADYLPPAGGWDYFIDFESAADDQYTAATGVPGNLDGNWIRAVIDSWDGSAPDEVGPAPAGDAPGGIEVITSTGSSPCGTSTGVLRVLNPGDPSNPGGDLATEYPEAYDEPNNRTLFLGYDTGVSDRNLLRDGVTFAARWRVRPPEDTPAYMNPSSTGDGAPLEGGDRGQVGIYFYDDGSLGTAGDSAALSFSLQSGDALQVSTETVSSLDAHDIDLWRSIWVTVEDPEADDTYNLQVWVNGQTTPIDVFGVTTDVELDEADFTADIDGVDTPYFGSAVGNFLALGVPGSGQDADIEIDYLGYKEGIHAPSATPCGGGAGFRRGDADSNGAVNITDGIFILNFLFLGGPSPTCREAANADNDQAVSITDGIYILNFLFLGGPGPLPPGSTTCGPDPDPAGGALDLGCASYPAC